MTVTINGQVMTGTPQEIVEIMDIYEKRKEEEKQRNEKLSREYFEEQQRKRNRAYLDHLSDFNKISQDPANINAISNICW